MIVVDASLGHVITSLPAENVYELGFSPLGTFIITWQRHSKDDNGDAIKNLKVWRVVEGGPDAADDEHNVVGRFVQKSQTGWNLQYTYDEQYCARVVTNEVQFYQSGELATVWNKLRVEGVTDFAVSPGENHSIAVFIPERKVGRTPAHNIDRVLTTTIGSTCCSKGVQRAKLWCSGLSKKFLQGGQSSTQMERSRDKSHRIGSDRSRQVRQELLRGNNFVSSECQWRL